MEDESCTSSGSSSSSNDDDDDDDGLSLEGVAERIQIRLQRPSIGNNDDSFQTQREVNAWSNCGADGNESDEDKNGNSGIAIGPEKRKEIETDGEYFCQVRKRTRWIEEAISDESSSRGYNDDEEENDNGDGDVDEDGDVNIISQGFAHEFIAFSRTERKSHKFRASCLSMNTSDDISPQRIPPPSFMDGPRRSSPSVFSPTLPSICMDAWDTKRDHGTGGLWDLEEDLENLSTSMIDINETEMKQKVQLESKGNVSNQTSKPNRNGLEDHSISFDKPLAEGEAHQIVAQSFSGYRCDNDGGWDDPEGNPEDVPTAMVERIEREMSTSIQTKTKGEILTLEASNVRLETLTPNHEDNTMIMDVEVGGTSTHHLNMKPSSAQSSWIAQDSNKERRILLILIWCGLFIALALAIALILVCRKI